MNRSARRAPREVFLSHTTKDRPFATRVSEILAAHGVPVWYSTTEIVGAQQWQDEIGKALKRCDPDRLAWALSTLQYVDYRKSFASGCRDLLRIWGKGYRP